jgi:superfamily II DNA or RNA helicase
MIIRIPDNHWLYVDQVSSAQVQTFIDRFSVQDPNSRFVDTSVGWDGWYRKFDVRKYRLALPFLHEFLLCCKENDFPVEVQDLRPKCPEPPIDKINPNMLAGITLEEYQMEAIKACLQNEIGCVSSGTGSGKSEVMCALVKLLDYPTVIITEQLVILDQIVQRLQLRDVVREQDIGVFCTGRLPDSNKPVIVGSIRSIIPPTKPDRDKLRPNRNKTLSKLLDLFEQNKIEELRTILPSQLIEAISENPENIDKLTGKYLNIISNYFAEKVFSSRKKWYLTRYARSEKVCDIVRQCEMLLVDEVDLCTSKQYLLLCKSIFNGRRRYGFTGTAYDAKKPIQTLLLKENMGNVIYEVPRSEVQACGRIIPLKIYFIPVGLNGNKQDCRAYDIAVREEMITNLEFHKKVAKVCGGFPNEGTMILLDVSPMEPLGTGLEDLIPNSKFLWSKSSMEDRRNYRKMFEERKLSCMISGRIMKRGLDLANGVENLIIIGSTKLWSNVNQMIGRAVRLNKRGWARVFLFFFTNNKYLYKHSRESIKAVIDMGYSPQIIHQGKLIDGKEFVRKRYTFPK